MRHFLVIATLLMMAAHMDTSPFVEVVDPGETLSCFIEETIDSVMYEEGPDALMFSEEYRLALLGLVNRPEGHFDRTGWNFILQEDGRDIGVILDEDHSGIGRVDTVMFVDNEEEKTVKSYIEKYRHLAKREEKEYGIPAPITLAQGILESRYGKSYLATEANNHFGVKCFSKDCKQGHCVNKKDDSHKDFFKKYKSVEDSFRDHSKLLKRKKRYQSLFNLHPTDLEGWAKGLKKAGYATSPTYDKKLINIIKQYGLQD